MNWVTPKWRPSIALVVGLVCVILVSIPVLALLAVQLTSNQFVRETERSLINQAAIYAQHYAALFDAEGGPPLGAEMDAAAIAAWAETWHEWQPVLDLRRTEVQPPLPDFDEAAVDPVTAPDPRYQPVALKLLTLARQAQKTTLSGAIFLDHRGVNIRADRLQDFAAAPEVQGALTGRVASALRDRGDTFERHALTSLSRDTWYRVFVAYPVILGDRVIGVVYLSRTPSNFAKFVATERAALLTMLAATLLAAALVGLLLFRLFSRPVRDLSAQSRHIANGALSEPAPLRHYGVREIADLGENVMQMAKTLADRSRQVTTYTDHVTHELKSPITGIMGAAELLGSPDISADARQKLTDNITAQAARMDALLEDLRQMARLRDAPTTGRGILADMLPEVSGLAVTLDPASETVLPMLPDHGKILFQQLARNAVEHGAGRLHIAFDGRTLRVEDNGYGIAPEDAPRVLEPFFTTRRDDGGTGMGLAIVTAILKNYSASIAFMPCETGASVLIEFASPT